MDKKAEAQADFDKAIDVTILKDINQAKIGCLLVQYRFYTEGVVWLDKALALNPSLEIAKECRKEALKKK